MRRMDHAAPHRLSACFMTILFGGLMVFCFRGGAAHAQDGPTVTGAGSTWSQIAIDQWRSDVAKFGLGVNYQGVGSSAGRQFFVIGQVDFAGSEIPFEPDELEKLKSAGRSFQYLPVVAGGTSLMYNLNDASGNRITNLKLSARTAGGIFTGRIKNWNDAEIAGDNGGKSLPNKPIIPVLRSDGSGTSAQFSAYLMKAASQDWSAFAAAKGIDPNSGTSFWPEFSGSVSQKGSDGVSNYVANVSTGQGAIGYVEAGYALQRGFPVASMKNQSGAYTQPTAHNTAMALTKAVLNPDRTQNLDGVYTMSDPTAYPISSYSYMITQTTGFDEAKGQVLGKFILYFACEGQQKAEVLGYSPLPPNLVQMVFDAVSAIPGAPKPPAMSECANPTVGGRGPLDPGGGGGGGDSGSSSSSDDGSAGGSDGSGLGAGSSSDTAGPGGGDGGGSGSSLNAEQASAAQIEARDAARLAANGGIPVIFILTALGAVAIVVGPPLMSKRGYTASIASRSRRGMRSIASVFRQPEAGGDSGGYEP